MSSGYRHGEAPESSWTRQEVGGSNRKEAGQRLEKAATVQPSWSMGQGLRKFVRGITTNSWNHNRDSLFLLDLKR